ncbi:ankyrin repeat domain-containing protein [Flavobacterium acetivorans]|uniref:ankyrin repeat domain-containing protein n=1 Tax=Flavobacterium acetivorans TaxID=2893883 RepID=UPI001E6090AE|nr:ankyrin repeat domain-containing protein [Flavobacterium sp. F-29]UFH34490.1 ankyrin repeat domain-containing protein [Flavobacterium sp. F-29]
MKKILFSTLLLIASVSNGQNTLLNGDFWKKNPDLTTIKETIAKGNSPSEANGGNFDAVTMAINNDASLESILFLIQQDGNSVKKLTHDGRTYLHWAASKGNVDLVKFLLEKGADINLSDDKGAIPIAFAAANGQANAKIYELFFKAGNNPKQKFKNGANILLLSIPNDKELKLADYLATKGLSLKDTDDLGNTAFNYAARSGDVKLLQTILKKGIKYDGRALIIASQGTRSSSATLEAYKYLVEDIKINPNSLGDEGENVLHNLVKKPKQDDIIAYFLAKGVDVNHQDKAGNSVLMNATRGNIELVKTFISKVKDVNAINSKGLSALSFAVENGSSDMVGFLLANGAKTNVIDAKGNNLAYYLIQSVRKDGKDGFDDKLSLLKNSGFDITIPQKDGNTLYHLAVAKNELNLFKKISALDIDINAKNQEGMTALHKAALTAKEDSILKFLVASGAKKDILTEFDETAYDLAKENESLTKANISVDFLK